MSSDNIKGLVLALSSSFFIGASFIVKKKGLKKAGASGVRRDHLKPGWSVYQFMRGLPSIACFLSIWVKPQSMIVITLHLLKYYI
uniref:Magnesium transporter n=1 Tax=Musa acuminata subsp. malaccensis TaxID=214687 RepID=A0A804IF90_MUSAM